MKNPLKGYTIAVTGDFGADSTQDKIRRWVIANGGTFTSSVTADTTHLVCSKEHWKRQVQAVKTALQKEIFVVSYDWLEDCLQNGSRKREKMYLYNKKRREKSEFRRALMRSEEEREQLRKEVRAFKDAPKSAQDGHTSRDSSPDFSSSASATRTASSILHGLLPSASTVVSLEQMRAQRLAALEKEHQKSIADDTPLTLSEYHIYKDDEGVEHEVTLTRVNIHTNQNERIQLRVYESNDVPHTYATFMRYHGIVSPAKPQQQPNSSIKSIKRPIAGSFQNHEPLEKMLAAAGSPLDHALGAFSLIFNNQTGIPWTERNRPDALEVQKGMIIVKGVATPRNELLLLASLDGQKAEDAKQALKSGRRPFTYRRPQLVQMKQVGQ